MGETNANGDNKWSVAGGGSSEGGPQESSFASWASYRRALKQTGSRLRDRATARSLAHTEMNEVRARSGHEMKRSLSWWDLVWFAIGSVVGAAVFVLTGLQARDVVGPSVVLSFAISGFTAMLSVFCYTEFAVEIPVAGGSFAYLRVELGDLVAYIAAGNIIFDCIIGCAAISRSWTSYFATLINRSPNDIRIHVPSFASDYSHLDPLAVLVLVVVGLITVLSTKGTSRVNNLASIIHILIILFIIVAGLLHANPANLTPFTPFGSRGVFSASAVLFFAFTGFDAVATMAEETKNPARDVPIGLIGAMSVATLIYCLLALTLCLMQPYYSLDPDAPFSVAFTAVGMGWAKYIVALGALEGMTTALLVSAIGQARYVTHIARTRMVPAWLASVNERTGTPVNATAVMIAGACLIGFFTSLNVLSNLFSISVLFIFMLVAVALLVRRYYVTGQTSESDRNKFLAYLAAILGSSAATAVYWSASEDGSWVGYPVTCTIWFLATTGLWWTVPQSRRPEHWGVPLVPWLPSASILMNVFLLGSIDGKSFVRFGIWSCVLLVFYLFWGLHATYDMARAVSSGKVPMKEVAGVKGNSVVAEV